MIHLNYRICLLPKGLEKEKPNLSGGSVAGFAFENETDCYGKIVNFPEPSLTKLDWPLQEKIHKIASYTNKQPAESQMKIDYYLASWRDSPVLGFMDEYFGEDYIVWYIDVLKSIPTVEVLRHPSQSDESNLSQPVVNVLLWLLVGFKRPKVVRIPPETGARLLPMFGVPTIVNNYAEIFGVDTENSNKTNQSDLLRMSYGYICEAEDNVYPFLYHYESVGNEQFFVDKIDFHLKPSEWSLLFAKNAVKTILVVEYNPSLVSPLVNYSLDSERPTSYYVPSTSGIRITHLIRLKCSCLKMSMPRKIVNLVEDCLFVSSWFLLSSFIVYTMVHSCLVI